MDKLCRFIGVFVPNTVCNLRCPYCYLQYRKCDKHKFPKFNYTPEEFKKILSRERFGGTCMINFTADGETLLDPQMIDYIFAVLEEGHFIEIITNATVTSAFEKIAAFPKEMLERIMFKCSFHYLELKKRGWLDRFFSNIRMIRDAGASFTVELMPHDDLIPFRKEIYDMCVCEVGAPCHLTVGRDASVPDKLPLLTKLSRDEYAKVWSMFNSKMFDFKLSVFEERRTEFCYAGEWMMPFYMGTGLMTQCYRSCRSVNIVENPNRKIRFKAIGHFCQSPHCWNSHAWMTFGCIPSLRTPHYDTMRNRVCADGSEWLQPRFKAFVHQQFKDNNEQYSKFKMIVTDLVMWTKTLRTRIPFKRQLKWLLKR